MTNEPHLTVDERSGGHGTNRSGAETGCDMRTWNMGSAQPTTELTTDDVTTAITDLAAGWRSERSDRLGRTALDRADFDAIADTGYLRAMVPVDEGGTWVDAAGSIRSISTVLRTLGAVDPSVALVSSMHPAVLSFWMTAPATGTEAWVRQRAGVAATAAAGQRWGTITSEPGSGGDLMNTRTTATPVEAALALPGRTYSLSGIKHFGSGMGVTDWMITTARPDGEDEPAIFFFPVTDVPWDGSAGLTLIAEWDGVGMTATQSHGMKLDGMVAVRYEHNSTMADIGLRASPFNHVLFASVITGILDEAVAVARDRLKDRRDELRPYERVTWADSERKYWLACQALEGAVSAVESADAGTAVHGALRGKQSIAELAEEIVSDLARTLGGGSFSQRSPLAHWANDVRALGFLRPPWALANDRLYETSW